MFKSPAIDHSPAIPIMVDSHLIRSINVS